MNPTVKIFRLTGAAVPPLPEIAYSRQSETVDQPSPPPDVLVFVGTITEPRDISLAVQIARGRSPFSIAVAMMVQRDQTRPNDVFANSSDARLLRLEMDSVFSISALDTELVVKRVIAAIITPGGADQLSGNDWNDQIMMIGGHARKRFDRYGFGLGFGDSCAFQAAHEAIRNIEQQAHGMRSAKGVTTIIRCHRKNLRARMIKEIMQIVRARAAPDASIMFGVDYDDAYSDDQLGVDIFAFGGPEERGGTI